MTGGMGGIVGGMGRDELPLAELRLRGYLAFLLLGRGKHEYPSLLLTGVADGTLVRSKPPTLILLTASVLVQFLEDGGKD